MYVHTCPQTGHVRKFASGRAFKKWRREQEAKYVPTIEEDIKAFGRATLGVGRTTVRSVKLTRSRKGNIACGGPRDRCQRWAAR